VDERALILSGKPDDKVEMDRLFEQYKLAVEVWDRVRARRQNSNSFYVAINAALVTVMSVTYSINFYVNFICVAGVLICCLWLFNMLMYKKLIDTKQSIIIEIEKYFQWQPFSAERRSIGDGIVSFTWIERGIPFAFVLLYALAPLVLVMHSP
jgi:hypothetical protein